MSKLCMALGMGIIRGGENVNSCPRLQKRI